MSAPAEAPASRYATDPRPDLAADSVAWSRLLAIAHEAAGEARDSVLGVLHGLRCCGAGLEYTGRSWRITYGAMDPDEYAANRERWLVPCRNDVAALLLRLEVSQ